MMEISANQELRFMLIGFSAAVLFGLLLWWRARKG